VIFVDNNNSSSNTLSPLTIKHNGNRYGAQNDAGNIKPVEIAESFLNRFPEIERKVANMLIKSGELVVIPDDQFMKGVDS